MGSCFSVGLNIRSSRLDVPPSNWNQADFLQFANLKSFSLKVLKSATRNFHPDNVLGKGSVSKGWIDEQSLVASKPGTGTIIAVKKCYTRNESDEEWLAKINYLGRINHQNLVKLVGYCLEGNQRLLVYEFMHRGNLDNHLFGRGANFGHLSWNVRIKVALGIAKGLAYLHCTETDVRYHKLKSSNILIDSNFNAKLSDFGLAKEAEDGQQHVYITSFKAPEYKHTGCLTAKGEIYVVGVILLELLTGRRSVDKNRPSGDQILVHFAWPFLISKQKILHIMDPSMEGQYSSIAAKQAALLAMKCLVLDPTDRPKAEELVKALEQIQELQKASKVLQWEDKDNVGSYSRLVASTSDGV